MLLHQRSRLFGRRRLDQQPSLGPVIADDLDFAAIRSKGNLSLLVDGQLQPGAHYLNY